MIDMQSVIARQILVILGGHYTSFLISLPATHVTLWHYAAKS